MPQVTTLCACLLGDCWDMFDVWGCWVGVQVWGCGGARE